MLVLLWTMLLVCHPVKAENLLMNGDFEKPHQENVISGWHQGKHYGKKAKGSQVVLTDEQPRSGKYCLKVVSGTEDMPILVESAPVTLDADKTYIFSIYLKASQPDSEVRLFVMGADYKNMQNRSDRAGTDWKQFVVILPQDKKRPTKPFMVRFDLMSGGTLWADDASLSEYDPEHYVPEEYIGYRRTKTAGNETVTLQVGNKASGELKNINGVCFSYGFGAKELDPRFADIGTRVVRVHNALTNFRLIRRAEDFSLVYNFTELDKLLDQVVAMGAIPEVNLCFVPLQMVYNPDPNKIRNSYDGFYLGPPSNFKEWEGFIRTIVEHCRDRYDISNWYWIFGNEPSVKKYFSMGTEDDFYRLYQATVAGAISAYPQIKIGAGSFASRSWMRDFMARCGQDQTRLDLLSWHHYGLVCNDYKLVTDETRTWLKEYHLSDDTLLAIDEWNPSLPDGGQHDLSAGNYAAAHMAASIAAMLDADLDYQTFFIAHSYTRFGMIEKNGTIHPTFNAMRLFNMLGSERLPLQVDENEPYIGGLSTRKSDQSTATMVWYAKHYHDISSDTDKTVVLDLGPLTQKQSIHLYAIDDVRSNGFNNPKRQDLEERSDFSYDIAADGHHQIRFTAQPNSLFLLTATP